MYNSQPLSRQTIESALESHPDVNTKELASLLGVSPETLRGLLVHYGFREKQVSRGFETTEIPKWDLVAYIRNQPNTTIDEIAEAFSVSSASVDRLMSEYDLSLPKGPKIPWSPEEMERKVKHFCLHTRLNRKEIASRLGVSPPTVSNYVSRLKEKGVIPPEFTFRRP